MILAALRAVTEPLDAAMQPGVDAVLDALGVRDILGSLNPGEPRAVLAEIRITLLQGARLLFSATWTRGWTCDDPAMLHAAGDTSAGFAIACKQMVVPKLAGLEARMEAGGAFLDIGTGVGAFAIAMARQWPALRVVGVDVWAPSIAIAREQVRAAGLSDRIEVREQGGQDIPEINAFDLAWIPSLFIPPQALGAIGPRVFGAMRSGGWVLFALMNPGPDPLGAALANLRTTMWGAPMLVPADAEKVLTNAGFVGAMTLPSPPGSPVFMVAAQREE